MNETSNFLKIKKIVRGNYIDEVYRIISCTQFSDSLYRICYFLSLYNDILLSVYLKFS